MNITTAVPCTELLKQEILSFAKIEGRPSGDTVFSRSWLDEAVSRAVGENRHVIAVPLADIVVPAGYLPVPADVPVLYTD